MSFFDTLLLNAILIIFPVMCMFIIKATIKNVSEVSKNILIDIANFLSIFLLMKFCDYDIPYSILLINIPFVISILYDRRVATVILAFFLVYFNAYHGLNYLFVFFEYLFYVSIFSFILKKWKSYKDLISFFIFIKGIFLTIYEFYILGNNNYLSLVKIFICLVLFYLICILIIELLNMLEKIINLNYTFKQLEREKDLKNSLFKITHEVKNPIAVCKGYLSMMDYGDLNKVKRYNDIILGELNRTLDIMNNFSLYNKISVNLDIMDLDYLLDDVVSSFKVICMSKGISINYTSLDEVYINGDYNRLKQVFVNVIKNSIEAIGSDGVIDIWLKLNRKSVVIFIKDNGCGIDEDDINKIGELFYSSKDKGCGIGVALSNEIVKLHGGFIKYKSSYGEYTEVSIKLPLHDNV